MAKEIDLFLFILIIALSFLGLINFSSVSLGTFENKYSILISFIIKVTFLGFIAFFIGNFLGKRLFYYKKFFIFAALIIYLSIFLGFFSWFRLQEEAARWVKIDFFKISISFQPSELIKPFAILFFIFFINGIKKFFLWQKIFTFFTLVIILLAPIFLQPSLSNVLILALSLIIVFFNSLKSFKEYFISISIILISFLILIILSLFWSYRLERLQAFLSKGEVYGEKYFQVSQAVLGVSSGGMWGKGLGRSEIKNVGLPQMLNDSIFVIYAEEFGFVGSVILLILFFLLIWRIIYLGYKSGQIEKRSFAFAVATWLFMQTFLHLASNTGLLVPTGVVLPFFSAGASAQLAIYFSLGIISSFKK